MVLTGEKFQKGYDMEELLSEIRTGLLKYKGERSLIGKQEEKKGHGMVRMMLVDDKQVLMAVNQLSDKTLMAAGYERLENRKGKDGGRGRGRGECRGEEQEEPLAPRGKGWIG